MSHDLEEPGKVVLRLPGGVRPAQVEGGEILPELDEDFLPAGRGEIKARVRSHLGLARSDEELVILKARRLGLRFPCRCCQGVPGAGQPAADRGDPGGTCDGLEQALVGPGVEQPRQQRVVSGARLILLDQRRAELERGDGRAHFLTSCIEISSLFSIMSTTRQSPHICRRFSEPSPANIEWPVSLPSMLPTICRVPKGLPQRTQLNGSASLRTTSCFACAASSRRGASVIAFSGQVFSHSPHCTQLRSMNFSIGWSRPSCSADSGHAPTQAMHSVQVCLLTSTWPYGAPAPSAMLSCALGASFARCSSANSSVARFSAARL